MTSRAGQVGIVITLLGIMLAFMGLFPGVTGLEPVRGVGIVQLFSLLSGMTLMVLGALLYVRLSFYRAVTETLAQIVGMRLAYTGLIVAGMAGLADPLGFGSHSGTDIENVFGFIQAAGVVGGFVVSSLGVLLYALAGTSEPPPSPPA